ncbi:DUF2059 domain-containing protein [Marinomonas balearica]|uniref:DUF2059 domain-containing protein n=1 Tax=Marinomonas balearica TaxID=491947 RepID=A0A4R6MA62_9GAMM|nr:DUF2059 domain-containing protein [Marinomonas balearica]TDO97945.1 hypothetical protein DFP79_1577 [Marinomonas balearica]
MKKALIIPLLCFTLATPAVAQETPVDELFRVMDMEKQMAGGFEAMLPIIDQMSTKFQLDNEGKEELREVFRTWFNEDIDRKRLTNEIKKLYSQTFSDDEMRKVTEFYSTPTGQKFLEKSIQLMQLSAQLGMQEGQAKQAKLMERVTLFLEKRGIN